MPRMLKKKRQSRNTNVTAIRLTRQQIDDLKNLPEGVSVSVLVRTLIAEYLAGQLPYIHALVLQEALRTSNAIENNHFS